MISRCPSCGFQVKEDERFCGSCGWDFVAQKRIPLPGKQASVPLEPIPPPRAAAAKAGAASPKTAAAPVSRRGSPVYIAAVAGAAVGAVSVLAAYLILRQESAPTEVPSPVAAPAPSATTPPPAPKDESRPTASFTPTPRVTLVIPVPTAPKTTAPQIAPPRPAVEGPTWAFEGVIFDLLTARGVFAAKLSFRDPDGKIAGETSTGDGGNYRIVLPAGGSRGYFLKIIHGDYTERYIDDGDATSSLREATPEERKLLMQAGMRNLPWVGVQKKPVRRDLGLVPRITEEP